MIPTSYPDAKTIAQLTAKMLLDIKAVHFNAEEPFTLASGLPSPTYIDCRKLISFPRIRATLMDFLTCTVMRDAGLEAFDNIAGGETAGIPFAALVAERMALPMTYVRKKPKGYGRNARIEGVMSEGERVLLVEDLTTDGGSKLSFVDAIRETGATCDRTAVIFYYGIFPETEKTLSDHGVGLSYLCTWWDVLEAARDSGAFDKATLDEVQKFLNAPREWQEKKMRG
ncbi:orotate phosphoribosyltransferase [Pseudohalocynthiibacter aestuariivivens]|jgi:orotate phosphoribosyltransferase|uniref:Orotate phosphoribosyltransferase n=1 Tax=Pseudohalocynthiibacter aestuariivivens TaxID=1591409 RepID=A0ABV5JLS6_9RHOB|nr:MULTISPECIES: orotate phosphoribosyltransferase [Pseudohalocynthiibacter]MBS9716656.1 orotate phosphoribosyltransferase [Pseudohalocynthiibacter aestuariivivens]MCK0101738.1 orotate phosphoribosyltransferase [Pseudohalocynthiibacter sp. F2068]